RRPDEPERAGRGRGTGRCADRRSRPNAGRSAGGRSSQALPGAEPGGDRRAPGSHGRGGRRGAAPRAAAAAGTQAGGAVDVNPVESDDLDAITANILRAIERGEVPDAAAWVARHPAHAAELADFFADLDRFGPFLGMGSAAASDETVDYRQSADRA